MKPYDRPTDSLPISRRTVIMNAGLAAAALAGLSSCTNYSTAPAASHRDCRLWHGSSSASRTTHRRGNRHTRGQRQDLP